MPSVVQGLPWPEAVHSHLQPSKAHKKSHLVKLSIPDIFYFRLDLAELDKLDLCLKLCVLKLPFIKKRAAPGGGARSGSRIYQSLQTLSESKFAN